MARIFEHDVLLIYIEIVLYEKKFMLYLKRYIVLSLQYLWFFKIFQD